MSDETKLPTSGLISILDGRLAPGHSDHMDPVYVVYTAALGYRPTLAGVIDPPTRAKARVFAQKFNEELNLLVKKWRSLNTSDWLDTVGDYIKANPYTGEDTMSREAALEKALAEALDLTDIVAVEVNAVKLTYRDGTSKWITSATWTLIEKMISPELERIVHQQAFERLQAGLSERNRR